VMRSIKGVLDPRHLFNPGRLLPLPEGPSGPSHGRTPT